MFQMESRLQKAAILHNILGRNPSWRQKSHRLSGPVDHTNPSNWTGNRICDHIVLNVSWQWGKRNASKALPSNYNTSIDDEDVTIWKPNGFIIGVSAFADGDDRENDQDDIDRKDSGEEASSSQQSLAMDDQIIQEEAFVEFEDALHNGESSEHPITVTFEGKVMYKASVLRLISSGVGLTKSGNRLRRVQGLSKISVSRNDESNSNADEIGGNIVTVKDQLDTLVTSDGKDVSLIMQ